MRIERIAVNPTKAQEWLGQNLERNRPISKGRVRSLAGDMTNGRWRSNGETLKFDRTGRLIDGQHRLSAVIAAERTVEFDVAFDVPEDAVQTIDQGRSRGAADVLHMHGLANAKVLSGSAKIVMNYLDGYNPSYTQTAPAIQDFVDRFPDIEKYAGLATSLFGIIPPSPVGAVLYLGSVDGTRAKMVDTFVAGLRTGVNLDEGDPRLALRTSVANLRARQSGSKAMDLSYTFHITTRAWNAYVDGRTLTMTRYAKNRKNKPIIVDVQGGPRSGVGQAGLRRMIEDLRVTRTLERNRA